MAFRPNMAGTRRRGVWISTHTNQINQKSFEGIPNTLRSNILHLAHPIQAYPDPGGRSGFLPLSG
jgi:hypothetical protein